MIKIGYKNIQDKWQDKYANWFIKLLKKKYFKNYFFKKFQMSLLKTIFRLMISIYFQ